MPKTTIYFDGDCPLCRAEISHYEKQDTEGALHLVNVADPETALPAGTDRDAALARFHVATASGRVVSGAAAFVEVWGKLPGWRWLARIARVPGVVAVLELGYRAFLPIRPLIVGIYVRATAARAPGDDRA